MKALTEQRKLAEYESKSESETVFLLESKATRANWAAIFDWAIHQGYLTKP